MNYTNVKLLYPPTLYSAEYRIPGTAQLKGLAYDYSDHTIVTYDAVEKKFMWISRDDAAVIGSCIPDDDIDEVIGISQFNDFIYVLSYEAPGKLAVFTGSMQVGRDTGVMHVTRHNVPNTGTPSGGAAGLWSQAHAAIPGFMYYHPEYCSIFNIGSTIYLILGITNDLTRGGSVPTTLGQYVVEFELNGMMRNHVKIDNSGSYGSRARTITGLNGTAAAGAFHDGVLDLLCRETTIGQANVVHTVRTTEGSVGVVDSGWYISGTMSAGTDMVVAGRYIYTLIDNRIYKADLMMFSIYMSDGWPNSQTLDMGSITPDSTTFRHVRCKNIAPATTFYDLTIYSRDPMLLLSLTNSSNRYAYGEAVTISGRIEPGDVFDLYVCLSSPDVTDEKLMPMQYYNTLIFRPQKKVDYA